MTQAPDPLREALAAKLAEMELHDATGDPRDEGYMAAWREFRDALVTVPAESEAWEWRVTGGFYAVGSEVTRDERAARASAAQWQGTQLERRRPGTAPGPWERVDPEPRYDDTPHCQWPACGCSRRGQCDPEPRPQDGGER